MIQNTNDLQEQGYNTDILESIKKHIIVGNVFRIIGIVIFSLIGIAAIALLSWNAYTSTRILNAVYDPCTGSSTIQPSYYYDPYTGQTLPYQQERNNFKMPDYHRLDVGANFHFPHKAKSDWCKDADHILNISIYNLYCHDNPYMIIPQGTELRQISFFPILPSLSYTFKF